MIIFVMFGTWNTLFKVILLLLIFSVKEPWIVDVTISPLGKDMFSLHLLMFFKRLIEFVTCRDAPESMIQLDTLVELTSSRWLFGDDTVLASVEMQPIKDVSSVL